MGFHRQPQPEYWPIVSDETLRVIRQHVAALIASEAAFASRTADPFNIDHDCLNPSGHDFVACCGEVVCQHCARIAWR